MNVIVANEKSNELATLNVDIGDIMEFLPEAEETEK